MLTAAGRGERLNNSEIDLRSFTTEFTQRDLPNVRLRVALGLSSMLVMMRRRLAITQVIVWERSVMTQLQVLGLAKILPACVLILLGSFLPAQAQEFAPSVVGDVATVEVDVGADIQPAFDFLQTFLADNASINSGVVDVTSSTSFTNTVDAHSDIVLNIQAGVVLSLDAGGVIFRGINLSNTSNSGITGGGVLDVNENAQFGVHGVAVQSPIIGWCNIRSFGDRKLANRSSCVFQSHRRVQCHSH